ncbi:Uncharacterized protein SCF082_LOCUS26923 [Durusdinium trenchii]|uniref:Uncharacterized protein n=1 Tax=Durusdinium trenchii TaxID=1381693 RepID=A0ABP0M9Y9_9DINO
MPTKHPSAWRLNKAEEKSVEADLAAWEARQSPDTSPEELALKRSEERKRLVRVIQEAKHKASLEKQSGVAAKTKLSAKTTRSGMTIPDAADSSPPCNGEYYEALKQDLAVIEKDVYQLEKAKIALEAHGTYICSCNLYWLDSWKTPAPGVPLSRARLQQLADFYFPAERQNNFFQKLLEVQVDQSALSDKPTGLVVISPLEIVHSIFLKAAEELGQAGVTAARKEAWAEALTAVPVVMVEVPEGDVWVHALNRRQLLQQEHESLTRTAWQNAAELYHLQALMEKIEGRKLTETEVVQLLKSKHLMTAQKGQSAMENSYYCEWNFTAAKTIFAKLQSDQVISDIVQKQECLKGSDSCFNSLVKLEKLAQRPSCVASRRFIFQLIDDMLCHGVLKDDDLNKNSMVGNSNNVGLIHLFEFKWRSLSYILDIMAVQAKLADKDRALLKEHLSDPKAARENTVDHVSWQAGLSKASLEALTYIQDVVFLKTYDNLIKQAMKPNSHPEILNEIETVQEVWKVVCNLRDNELAEDKAASKALENQSGDEEDVTSEARGHREVGKSCTLVHLDTSLLGESTGPECQEGLRKVWRPDEAIAQKLLGSTLVALGAQQDKSGKCGAPGEGTVAAVLDPLGVVPKTFFKDACSQTESIRARKKKVRSHSYTQRLELTLYSEKSLSVILPEKVDLLSAKRIVSVEGKGPADLEAHETCFSCSLAPSEFYTELIHSYCASSVIDASPAQGEFLKACLSNRTKAVAICGTESHGACLELLLTDHVLGELSREGSTFFRPDSVSKDDEEDKQGTGPKKEAEPKKKQPKRKAGEVEEPQPKKGRGKPKKVEKGEGGEEEEAEEKPKKKNKKDAEEHEDGEESSELW